MSNTLSLEWLESSSANWPEGAWVAYDADSCIRLNTLAPDPKALLESLAGEKELPLSEYGYSRVKFCIYGAAYGRMFKKYVLPRLGDTRPDLNREFDSLSRGSETPEDSMEIAEAIRLLNENPQVWREWIGQVQ